MSQPPVPILSADCHNDEKIISLDYIDVGQDRSWEYGNEGFKIIGEIIDQLGGC
jgi:hypothetical protein